MKIKNYLAFSLLFISSSVLADHPPTSCPSVANIKAVGLSMNYVKDSEGHWYFGRSLQNYNTNHIWSFVIGCIKAPNLADARAKAMLALNSLTYDKGPYPGPLKKWICSYRNSRDVLSGAITPPMNADHLSGIKFK